MSQKKLSISDFDYHLPQSLIAQKPASPRDHSRLLVFNRKDRSITDDYFYNIAGYLPANSSLVLNNSRVEKARLLFGNKEIFITRIIDPYTVEAMIRPGKRFQTGKTVTLIESVGQPDQDIAVQSENPSMTGSIFDDLDGDYQKIRNDNPSVTGSIPVSPEHNPAPAGSLTAEVLHTAEDGLRNLRFNYPVNHPVFNPFRHTPFPPYIKPDEGLSGRYQTIYAKEPGSKAAPTAGLHFTDRVFSDLSKKSIRKIELTLHVGLGTFAPVKTGNIRDHKMHREWFRITPDAAEALRNSRFITAVGTTSARVLESVAAHSRPSAPALPFRDFQACEQETDIFITPGYQFRTVDALLTNFHLPKSTLLMMLSAFTGLDEMHRIYRHAIHEKYRFYSFGDAMLLL